MERTGSSLWFRGVTDAGRMVFGFPRIIGEGTYIMPMGERYALRVRPETVGQCSGMKDTDGVAIFEGDVAEATYDEFDRRKMEIRKGLKNTFLVRYCEEEGRWMYQRAGRKLYASPEGHDGVKYEVSAVKVIGNIWDGTEYDEEIYDNGAGAQ